MNTVIHVSQVTNVSLRGKVSCAVAVWGPMPPHGAWPDDTHLP